MKEHLHVESPGVRDYIGRMVHIQMKVRAQMFSETPLDPPTLLIDSINEQKKIIDELLEEFPSIKLEKHSVDEFKEIMLDWVDYKARTSHGLYQFGIQTGLLNKY